MRNAFVVMVVLALAGSAWAVDINVPLDIEGLWRFQNSANKLKATLGADLVTSNPDNPVWWSGPWTMIGYPWHAGYFADGGYVQDRSWDYLTCYHGIGDGVTGNGGGSYINEYTIAMDVKCDPGWNSLYQTAWSGNANDGDLWIDASTITSATIGVGGVGYSTMTFDASKWHRIVLSVDNGNFFRAYVDGTLYLDGAGQSIDGRFSLELDRFNLFADDSWEDVWTSCGTLAVWGRALTTEEIAPMGGWIRTDYPDQPTGLVIPEPGAVTMLLLGVLGLLSARVRRG